MSRNDQHRDRDPREAPDAAPPRLRPSRRSFLEATGFALFATAVTGCGRDEAMIAPAPATRPATLTPGKSRHYASVCHGCSAACGILVKNRDGRPIKFEGNPAHPLSRGGLCPVGQASILGLYDSLRLTGPLARGKAADWKHVDQEIGAALDKIESQGGTVRVLTDSVLSPTRRAVIERFLERFDDARHVAYDPLSSSAILAAHKQTHGAAVLPHYRLDQAEVIVSFDADFLGTWIAPVEFTAAYQAGRTPQGKPPRMSHHVQFESRMSLTGGNADRRAALAPGELGLAMSHLAVRLARKAGQTLEGEKQLAASPVSETLLDELTERLWQSRGKALILCGSQEPALQVLCNYLNETLKAYGATLDIERPSYQRQGDDAALHALVQEIQDGKVSALLVAGVNPVYDLPGGEKLAAALRKIPLVVSFASETDETAELAHFVCPEGHALETWGDAEPVAGVVSIAQPTVKPLGQTRSLLESLAQWSGQPQTSYDLVREHWEKVIHPRTSGQQPFAAFWNQALKDGFVEAPPQAASVEPFDVAAVSLVTTAPPAPADRFTLALYPKVGMLDGRHAQNPWLQELPDPVSKVTWDNYACLSPSAAAGLKVGEGDVVRIAVESSETLELPVVVQPGQHDNVVAVALGYGRKGTERFAKIGPQWLEGRPSVGPNGLVGVNAAPLLRWDEASLHYEQPGVTVTATGRNQPMAATQKHHEITVPKHLATPGAERRPVVEQTTLADYAHDPHAGSLAHHHATPELWPDDHRYDGHRWGMAIDLSKCTGCSGCVIACQAENNTPVVGKDEVRRSREMHWLRIDRYYEANAEGGVDVAHQPMMCHHCGNAPCETVCPVLATVHSDEGLNQQVYNRCVGTRYCANNCPYKTRRFNWFEYARPDELQNAVLNPDVTVRSRGVMEKCSFCVQRIQEAKIEAKRQGRELADGDILPACQQSCPARAIVFGDLNDPESEISKLLAGPRAYQVLGELNVQPAVSYLRLVRNRPSEAKEHHHV